MADEDKRLEEVFVPVLPLGGEAPLPEGLERLVRKFDPVARDRRNRQWRQLGEATSRAGLPRRQSKPVAERPAGATQQKAASRLGEAGERFVLEVERQGLASSGRADLARKVRWISAEDGDGAGYDVLSFDPGGRERLLEVKTTNGSGYTPFFLSRNEYALAQQRPADWRLYRVHLFASQPRIFSLAPPLEDTVRLQPESWCARLMGGQTHGAHA